MHLHIIFIFFFFNDTATTEIYTLSLHDALPILVHRHARVERAVGVLKHDLHAAPQQIEFQDPYRSEEHTSELQSQSNLVCRLLLEKKKTAPCVDLFELFVVWRRSQLFAYSMLCT